MHADYCTKDVPKGDGSVRGMFMVTKCHDCQF